MQDKTKKQKLGKFFKYWQQCQVPLRRYKTVARKKIYLKNLNAQNRTIKKSQKETKTINNRDKAVIAKRFALILWKTERKEHVCTTACSKIGSEEICHGSNT